MISVLIPTYRWNSFPLVEKIHQQISKAEIPFEIIVIDDASNDDSVTQNRQSINLSNTSFQILPQNIGRSTIRNLLAEKARFSWLLFLDADVMTDNDNFIHNYIQAIQSTDFNVFAGGMYYKETYTKSSALRWKFGKFREAVSMEERLNNPMRYLFSANFLIRKSIFKDIRFNEKLKGYGYEDFLFAKDLSNHGFSILHIDNPIYHLEIDSNKKFVDKTKQGIKNLAYLFHSKTYNIHEIKLVKTLKKYKGLIFLITPFSKLFEKLSLQFSLLFFFDLFRITYLYKLIKKLK
ncbi:glycosyltransferase [uncultured Tenacibaculum sp.]|uniref:glycosyltransferase family 2 protein n=1 Tax=uncultured Tenacibaculum sp. TaxID=174713 RepID=UPI0026359738|nr:glycosyltransferase [uncultured Tenacibaculum sp.]